MHQTRFHYAIQVIVMHAASWKAVEDKARHAGYGPRNCPEAPPRTRPFRGLFRCARSQGLRLFQGVRALLRKHCGKLRIQVLSLKLIMLVS